MDKTPCCIHMFPNLNYRVIAFWNHQSPAQFSYRALAEQSTRHHSMKSDSASNSPDPTVRRGRSVICLPLAYTQHGHSTGLAILQQIRCRATDWCAVCSVVYVQSNGGPAACNQLTTPAPSRVKTKTMRQVGTTQPVSRLTSVSTHTMSPSIPTHAHPPTHTLCPQNHRTPTSEFLSRACALHHAGRQGPG